MSGKHHAPQHLRVDASSPRLSWTRPILAATLLLGMAGVVILRPAIGGGDGEGPSPTSIPAAEGEAISPPSGWAA